MTTLPIASARKKRADALFIDNSIETGSPATGGDAHSELRQRQAHARLELSSHTQGAPRGCELEFIVLKRRFVRQTRNPGIVASLR